MQATFPTVIDNSMRSTFTDCPREFFFKYVLQRQPMRKSVHLHAGGAFAAGIETARNAYFSEGKTEDDAIYAGYNRVLEYYGDAQFDDEVKTAERMAGALNYYFSQYPMSSDFIKPFTQNGKPCIEFSFGIPLPINHPVTGDPLIYAGRFDMIGVNEQGVLYIVDEKTTSALGPTWGKRYDLSSQFTGYTWACHQYGVPVGGVLIRGVSILKTKYDKAQHIMYRPDWQVERWYRQLLRDIQRMIAMYRDGYYDYAIGNACGAFGGCAFSIVCSTNDEERWLESEYTHNDYNPLQRHQPAGE